MVWFWVQVALAALTVVGTVKAKREFKKQQKKLNKSQGFQINRFGQDEPLNYVLGERRVAPVFVYRGTAIAELTGKYGFGTCCVRKRSGSRQSGGARMETNYRYFANRAQFT